MESFSIRVDGPDQEQLLDELWPKLDEYCKYEVFDYASGNVVTIALEKFMFRINSNLLAVITMDFTSVGRCQIDIISGGGGEGMLNFKYGSEKSIVAAIIQMLVDICKAKGWKIAEDASEPDAEQA